MNTAVWLKYKIKQNYYVLIVYIYCMLMNESLHTPVTMTNESCPFFEKLSNELEFLNNL
jgi:hypothetical protein